MPMTEAEWLACTDPRKMLQFLHDPDGAGGRAHLLAPFLRRSSTVTSYGLSGERKERLLAVACCRLDLRERMTVKPAMRPGAHANGHQPGRSPCDRPRPTTIPRPAGPGTGPAVSALPGPRLLPL
jgi:hypothetical protein